MTGQFSFARAARGPKTGGSVLTFAPYARDAVGVLDFNHGGTAITTITRAQLATLYSAGGTSTLDGDTVYPCLTITGSSPRSNLETAIGVSDTTAEAAAKAAGCDQIQQNSGNAFYTFAKGIPTGDDAIIPISSGDWIGQANGVAVDESNTARADGVTITRHRRLVQPRFAGLGNRSQPDAQHHLLPGHQLRLQPLHGAADEQR